MNSATYKNIDKELAKVPFPITLQEKVELLVAEHGSVQKVARITRVDESYLKTILKGHTAKPSASTCSKLGLRKVVLYFVETPQ